MSLFIRNNSDDDFEKNLELYFAFFKQSFETFYSKNILYSIDDRFFKIDYDDRKKIIVNSNIVLECLKKDFDNMLEYLLKNKIEDTFYANYAIEELINYFTHIDIKISSEFLSYILFKTKKMSNQYNKDFSIVGIDTFINLFRDCLYKNLLTKKERENIYDYIFNSRKDLLEIDSYRHLNGYYLNKERSVSQYFSWGISILTNYPQYEEQVLKLLKVLVYKKEDTPSSYSFKDINFETSKIKNIPDSFFKVINLKTLLVIRNYQGLSSKIGKRINNYIIENLLINEEAKTDYAIYTAITLDEKYIKKMNKKIPDIFKNYLKTSFNTMYKNPHIAHQCDDFIKSNGLELNVRKTDFWNEDFYPLITKYIEEKK